MKEKLSHAQHKNNPVEILFQNIRSIWDSARSFSARSVNSAHSCAAWLTGRQIVESEQKGLRRGAYGEQLIKNISERLSVEYGSGFSVSGLQYMRAFYLNYPLFLPKQHALRVESGMNDIYEKQHAVRAKSEEKTILLTLQEKPDAVTRKSCKEKTGFMGLLSNLQPPDDESWKPGQLNANLSWTHYRTLLKVKHPASRNFYEIEAVKNAWSARQLERQINSLLFERLLKSRDKKGVVALANKGQEVHNPIDIIKDPVVLEFLDLPESHRLVETKIETALISKLKDFLLELGNGFAYVGRQKRLTLEGDHFYPDLVFYHIKLKCYVIIDLKTQKLTHGDLGQMQMYVHYYDRKIKGKDENPTLGIILCTDKNDAVVKYVLDEKEKQIFTSRYRFELPSVEELQKEIRREMEMLSPLSGKEVRVKERTKAKKGTSHE